MLDIIVQIAATILADFTHILDTLLPTYLGADLLRLSGLLICAAIIEALARKNPARRDA
ncbi:MAG TPA: hypothetical protein VK436_03880 [Methanocella sp.]|nr:hypothetical protein [Methanocella sp.]